MPTDTLPEWEATTEAPSLPSWESTSEAPLSKPEAAAALKPKPIDRLLSFLKPGIIPPEGLVAGAQLQPAHAIAAEQALYDPFSRGVGAATQIAHEALAPAASEFLRRTGIDPSSSPEQMINLPRVPAGAIPQMPGLPPPTVTAGIEQLGAQVAESLAQPEQAALIFATAGGGIVNRAASLLLAGATFEQLPGEIQEAVNTIADPKATTEQKIAAAGKPGVSALFGAAMVQAGFRPFPRERPTPDFTRGRFPGSVTAAPPGTPPGRLLLTYPGFEPEVPSEREISPTGPLPPEQRQPVVGEPEKQTQVGAPQWGGEGEEVKTDVPAQIPPVIRDVTPGSIPPNAIVPAIRLIGGKVISGQEGDTHPDIIDRHKIDAKDIDQRGFSDPESNFFLDREAAAKGTGAPTDFEAGRLHSTDLTKSQQAKPLDFEPALLINGKPVTGGVSHAEIFKNQVETNPEQAVSIFEAFAKDENHVFVDKKGKVYTRREAADALNEKEPLKSERLAELKTPAPAPTGPTTPVETEVTPAMKSADEIVPIIASGATLTKQQAHDIIAKHHGGTLAEGKFTAKDQSDIIELAVNKFINSRPEATDPSTADATQAKEVIRALKGLLERLPTQTTRTRETEEMQQFSTPPTEAFAANWVSKVGPQDNALEPSAGLAGIAVFGKNAGAHVTANELSPRRRAMLEQSGLVDQVLPYNAEHLHALMTPGINAGTLRRPTVVVMNPPFSQSATADIKRTAIGAKHVEEALKLLAPGGRLVAIAGEGMAMGKPTFVPWWRRISKEYNVRANVGVSGEEYRKYGTTFGNQMLVIDKTGPTPDLGAVITGNVKKVEDLIPLLEKVRNDRPAIKQAPAQPSGAPTAPTGAPALRPQPAPPAPTGPGGVGGPGGGRPPGQAPGGLQPIPPTPTVSPGGAPGGGIVPPGAAPAPPQIGTIPSGLPEGGEPGLRVEKAEGKRELSEHGIFSEYHPEKVKIPGAKAHPSPLVEPTAMAAVSPIDSTYTPKLDQKQIESGYPSLIQLEQVVYAGQAHELFLPTGERVGYFVGDGTGVGKGIIGGSIILDNWNRGRHKHVWVSKSKELIDDAKRDLGDLGFDLSKVIDFAKSGGREVIGAKEGVAFVPYSSLSRENPGFVSGSTDPGQQPKLNPPEDPNKPSRLHLLAKWLGPDFDGVIVFDEVHKAGNAIDIKGPRGFKEASEIGKSVVDIQRLFPKARIVYMSATGATDVTNLSYADRLGVWGHGTPFSSKDKFFTAIQSGGLSAMEIVARDLKSMGRYLARTLSFEGVTHRPLVHQITPEQQAIYDELSRAWQLVLKNRDETMAHTGAANSGPARRNANSAFYGAQQRFFNQLLTAMQVPSVLADMKAQLASGNSVVLQVVNTNEAILNREISEKATTAGEGENSYLEDLDLSPKRILLQYIEKSYPTIAYEPKTDDNGNTRWEPVRDPVTNEPVHSPEALAKKQELMDQIGLLKAPKNPLEMIFDTFGVENVAEVTGRTKRTVNVLQPDGTRKEDLQVNRSKRHSKQDAQDFREGKKRILIFSDAGGTGFSYHASRKFQNQQRRIHYLLQAGWRADMAMQGFGRTHRSDQVSAPDYVLVSTNIEGHKRFISTIARRLSELGAITGGERRSASKEMFDESNNLENQYAEDAVLRFFQQLHRGELGDMDFNDLSRKMGFITQRVNPQTGEIEEYNKLIDRNGGLNAGAVPSIQQFLNRILVLEVNEQNRVFGEFDAIRRERIENAKADGSYDPGTQTLRALAIRKLSDQVVYSDPHSTSKTRLVEIEHDQPVKITPWETHERSVAPDKPVSMYVRNIRSGRVFAMKEGPSRTLENGQVVDTWRRISPTGYDIVPRNTVSTEAYYGEKPNYQGLTTDEAKSQWDDEVAKAPKVKTFKDTYVVGTFLPIWDRLQLPAPKIWRMTTDKGEHLLGAFVPPRAVDALRDRLGASGGESETPQSVYNKVFDQGLNIELANGWTIKRSRVQGEQRIEVRGVQQSQMREFEDFLGGFIERINFEPRFFIPTDEGAALDVLKKILTKSPAIKQRPTGEGQSPAPYFDRMSELMGLGRLSTAPTLEDIRAQRASELSGGAVAEPLIGPQAYYTGLPLPMTMAEMREFIQPLKDASAFVRSFWRGFSMQQAPVITAADRETGEAGVRYVAAPFVARQHGLEFAGKVMAGIKDPKFDTQLGAAISEDNLRDIKQRDLDQANDVRNRFELIDDAKEEIDNWKEAAQEGDPMARQIIKDLKARIRQLEEYEDEDAERFEALAKGTFTFIGKKNSPFKTEDEYKAFLASENAKIALDRHRNLWREQKDPLFRTANDLDPDTKLETRGLETDARINLKAVVEPADHSPTTVGPKRSTLTKQSATFKRRDPFGIRAEGQGKAYEASYTELIAHGFEREFPVAAQHEFLKRLIDSGNAVVTNREFAPDLELHGESTKGYIMKLRPWRGNWLQVRKSLAPEYEAITGLNPAARIKIFTAMGEFLTKMSIMGIAEGSTHASNLLMEVFTGLGPTANPMINALLKVMFRSDLIYKLPRVLISGLQDNREAMLDLATIGAAKEPYRGLMGRLLNWADRGVRLNSDSLYRRMAQAGWVEDTETGRREFINQVGNYQKRLQPWLIRWLRDTHVQPFATAMQTFNVMGLRRLALDPGAKGPSLWAKLALRADILGGWIGFLAVVAVLNYLVTGDVEGPKGTRLGAVGWIGDDGKLHQFDLGAMTGFTRGAKITGLQPAIEAAREGISGNSALAAATRAMGNTAVSYVSGPGVQFLTKATTGARPGVPMQQEAPVVPPQDEFSPMKSQLAANVLTATRQANPAVDAVAGIVEGRPGLDIANRQLSRYTPRTGLSIETIEALPRIVKNQEINAYADALAKESRKIPIGQRGYWIWDRMNQDGLSEEVRARAWIELRKKGALAYP